jgi:hypothetical protein
MKRGVGIARLLGWIVVDVMPGGSSLLVEQIVEPTMRIVVRPTVQLGLAVLLRVYLS